MITYNVEKRSPSLNAHNFLQLDREALPDLIAVGLQEVNVKTSNLIGISSSDSWSKALEATLSRAGYRKLERTRMMGIVMLVYARPEFTAKVRSIQTSSRKTGFGGWVGNKGGVALSFQVILTNRYHNQLIAI